MTLRRSALLVSAVLGSATVVSSAATLAAWNFGPNKAGGTLAATSSSGVSASAITIGASVNSPVGTRYQTQGAGVDPDDNRGVNGSAAPAGGFLVANGFAGASGTVAADDYFEFSVTATTSGILIQSFSFDWTRTAITGHEYADLQVNTGSGFTSLGTVLRNPPDTQWDRDVIDFADFALAQGSTATFRLGISAGDAARNFTFDNFTVQGIPEPTGIALGGLGVMFAVLRRRR